MPGLLVEGLIQIPEWVNDFASFRRWSLSEDFPEFPRIFYLGDTIWVDPTGERFDHNQLKTEAIAVLSGLVRAGCLGRLYCNGIRLVHPETALSNEPDVFFVRQESFDRKRVQLPRGKASLELIGSPDMVLEIISPSSVNKDRNVLFKRYARAGIEEYWLIDAMPDSARFEIFHLTTKGYVSTRPKGGWLKSAVFDKQFRLTQENDAQGLPDFTLEMR
jgi:Uma2 family endonuclease